jgi:hypothetical protein
MKFLKVKGKDGNIYVIVKRSSKNKGQDDGKSTTFVRKLRFDAKPELASPAKREANLQFSRIAHNYAWNKKAMPWRKADSTVVMAPPMMTLLREKLTGFKPQAEHFSINQFKSEERQKEYKKAIEGDKKENKNENENKNEPGLSQSPSSSSSSSSFNFREPVSRLEELAILLHG